MENLLDNLQCRLAIQAQLPDVVASSGKYINQMGVFWRCLQNDSLKYMHAYLKDAKTNKANGLYWGLCLPKKCPDDYIMEQLNSTIYQATKNEFVVQELTINPQDYQPEFKWSFYLLVTFLTIIIILTIISAFSSKPKIFQVFSVKKSIQIFKYKKNSLNVFNGIKSLCMLWVIFGHQYSDRLQYSINLPVINHQVESFFYLFVEGAFYAVDIFFFVGGFLVAFSFLRAQSKSIMKYPMALLHRLLRFWPSYITAILIFSGLYMHLGSGPFWHLQYGIAVTPCQKLWKPLLFVDNLVDNGQDMCMGWGWYLQNDMQIFIFSLLILFVYSKNRMASYLLALIFVIASFSYNFIVTYQNQYVLVAHLADFRKWSRYFPDVYIKPWSRSPPYFYGLILGAYFVEYTKKKKQNQQSYFLIRFRDHMKNNKKIQWIIQGFGIALMAFILFIPRTLQAGQVWPQFIESAFLTFSKTLFVVALSIAITPSLLDMPSMVAFCMDTKFFNFISKISFWTYLIHYMVLMRTDYLSKTDFYYSSTTIYQYYVPHAFGALFFGLLGTLLVQVPFSKLQKKMFEKILSKEKRKAQLSQSLLTKSQITASLEDSFKQGLDINQSAIQGK